MDKNNLGPLKTKLLLMLIKDNDFESLISLIPYYLYVQLGQIPYLMNELKERGLIYYSKSSFSFFLTYSGTEYLKKYKLFDKKLEEIEAYEYEIDSEIMGNYIPK